MEPPGEKLLDPPPDDEHPASTMSRASKAVRMNFATTPPQLSDNRASSSPASESSWSHVVVAVMLVMEPRADEPTVPEVRGLAITAEFAPMEMDIVPGAMDPPLALATV